MLTPCCLFIIVIFFLVILQTLHFAVMSSDDGRGTSEAADFLTHVTDMFPALAHHWIGYDTESEFLDIIDDDDYSQSEGDGFPAFSAGIVFTSGSPDWAYTVRRFGGGEGTVVCSFRSGGEVECVGRTIFIPNTTKAGSLRSQHVHLSLSTRSPRLSRDLHGHCVRFRQPELGLHGEAFGEGGRVDKDQMYAFSLRMQQLNVVFFVRPACSMRSTTGGCHPCFYFFLLERPPAS